MRLYCIGSGSLVKWVTCENLKQAKKELGPKARTATDEDCRAIWLLERMWEYSQEELRERFKISKQAAAKWRLRAGDDLPTRSDQAEAIRAKRIRVVLKELKDPCFSSLVKESGVSKKILREYVDKTGLHLRTHRRRPPDDELIELQRGRTWRELAEVTGLQLNTLRQYVYNRPVLARAMAAVRVNAPTGKKAHKASQVTDIRRMYEEGKSAHTIAESLRIEQVSVLYWFTKWKKEQAHDQSTDGQPPDPLVAGGNDGSAGHTK